MTEIVPPAAHASAAGRPSAELIGLGREQVHVVESGPVDGTPLLLSSGLGGAWFDWRPAEALLAGAHRVIAFDRPGLGLSPAAHAAPTLRREVAVLAGLAERAGRPVVPVAHSVAAFHAEALARLRPDLVRGLVLVDPSYEPARRLPVRYAAALTPVATAAGALLGATRLARVVGPLGRRLIVRHSSRRDEPVSEGVVRSVYGRGTVLGTVLAEELAYREMAVDLARLRERRPFPAVPLVVITALGDLGDPAEAREWAAGHARLAAMSPYGAQVELPDALHMVQLDRPDAIADAVAAVLAGGPADAAGAADVSPAGAAETASAEAAPPGAAGVETVRPDAVRPDAAHREAAGADAARVEAAGVEAGRPKAARPEAAGGGEGVGLA